MDNSILNTSQISEKTNTLDSKSNAATPTKKNSVSLAINNKQVSNQSIDKSKPKASLFANNFDAKSVNSDSKSNKSSFIGNIVANAVNEPKKSIFTDKLFEKKLQAAINDKFKKKKRKLIKHCADDPKEEQEVEEEDLPEEDYLYKFKNDDELYKTFCSKFHSDHKISSNKNSSFSILSNLTEEDKIKIIEKYMKELKYESLLKIKNGIVTIMTKEEEQRSVSLYNNLFNKLNFAQSNKINSNQYSYEANKKIKKTIIKKVKKHTIIPKQSSTVYITPSKPNLEYESNINTIFIKESYNKEGRMYSIKEMSNFIIMRNYVHIENQIITVFHPPNFKFESENVYRINKKHYLANYNSDNMNNHERSEDDLFPKNKLMKFKLIDNIKEKKEIINIKKSINSPVVIDLHLNNKPSVKSFVISADKSEKSIKRDKAEKLNINKNKLELTKLLEKSIPILETTKHKKLDYFYKTKPESVTSVTDMTNHRFFSPTHSTPREQNIIFSMKKMNFNIKTENQSFNDITGINQIPIKHTSCLSNIK